MVRYLLACTAAVALANIAEAQIDAPRMSANFNVRMFGAKGDGIALDSVAINRAIETASAAGGGTVEFPAGTYRSVSIRLKSNICLLLDPGAILLAADHTPDAEYDEAEPNASDKFQDFGHTHFHNSLIWGEHLDNVSIMGRGEIYGKGLVRDSTKDMKDGNKAVSLRDCRNVTLRDVTIRHGGWFGILATGIDHLTIDNVILDTNRDGMDIDCCRDVHVSNCSVNSPHDDGICLKSSYALNEARPCENVTITNCLVSGFKEGTFLDGTYERSGYPTGRIKFGTESNGGFKNIAISNCVFDYSRGFALETVDGALLEDVTISNITMRDIVNAPFFLRLGRRMRGPKEAEIGKLHRVSISNVRVVGAREASIVAGIPGHPVEDVSFSNIRIEKVGGIKADQESLVPPEKETGYPEPESFGPMPANGFYVRHARNIEFHDVEVQNATGDERPGFVLDDVDGADFFQIRYPRAMPQPLFRVRKSKNLRVRLADGVREFPDQAELDGDF
jgi:polygalacturonase